MTDCIFCKIVDGTIAASKVYEDEMVLAFNDLYPAAPQHVLVIPKKHICTVNDLTPADAATFGQLAVVAGKIAAERGFAEAGYRLVMNCNSDGGQTVYHIHMHVLAGRQLAWPPG
jgi:histidine triad (HIT) family protein